MLIKQLQVKRVGVLFIIPTDVLSGSTSVKMHFSRDMHVLQIETAHAQSIPGTLNCHLTLLDVWRGLIIKR